MSLLSSIQPYTKLPFSGVILPEITISPELRAAAGATADCSNAEFLRQLCRNGFKAKLASLPRDRQKEYVERVKMELDIIEELGFTRYIVMVWDMCRFADEKGIPRGPGRGSVAGSLVSYLTGITQLDPVQNGLFFSRFLSKARAKKVIVDGVSYIDGSLVPDIDCDFSYYRRGEVIDYLNARYPGQTSKLLTTTTFTAKILIKDVLKVYENADEARANEASDLIEKKHGNPVELEDGMYGERDWRESKGAKGEGPNQKLVDWAADHEETVKITMGLAGLNRGEGQHASAVLICHTKLADLMPLQLSSEKELTSGFDMYSAQEIIIKMDILGLRTLDVIHEACKAIGISPASIDVHHPSIYAYLQDFRNRYGVFQLETFAQGNAAAKIKPKNFEQLTAVLAIARPGAFAYIDAFCDYLHNGVYTSVHPLIDDILRPTGGLALYQETYLAMLVRVGMTAERAENARRVLGKKKVEEVPAVKAEIEEVCKIGGHPPEIVDLLLKIAEDSGGFSFNLSHAASYAILTAWTIYLKVNHPIHFYWALLRMAQHESNAHEVIAQIEREMRGAGFQLLPPHLIKSERSFKIETPTSIRYGLALIRGISEKTVGKLETFRNVAGGYLDDYGLVASTKFQVFQTLKNAGLNVGMAASLIQAGCFTDFASSRCRMVLELCTWNLLSDNEKRICMDLGRLPEVHWDVLNAVLYLRDHTHPDGKPLFSRKTRFDTIKRKYDAHKAIYDLNRRNERLCNYWYERTVLGYSYSHTIREIFSAETDGLISISEAKALGAGEHVRLIGFVKEPERRKTKAGNDGFKLTLVDESDEITVRFFNAKIQACEEANGRLPLEDDIVIATGEVKDGACVFADQVRVQTAVIYMKLSQLRDETEKRAAQDAAVETVAAEEVAQLL